MTREQMREAIVEPAKNCGVRVTDPLVSRLLNDVGGHPDQAPMLQHTMMRLWAAVQEGKSTLDLDSLGAVRPTTSIGDHAEQIYASLDDGEKLVAEYLFRNITSVVGENETIRNPAELRTISQQVRGALHRQLPDLTVEDVIRVVVARRGERCAMLTAAGPLPLAPSTNIDS